MKLNFISDVHIFEQGDQHAEIFRKFLDESSQDDVSEVFLIGDIFDLLVGNHAQNSIRYQQIFNQIKELIKKGKKVWYFEGNHDLHLTQFFQSEFKEYWDSEFILIKNDLEIERFNKKFYISHGDYLTDHEPVYKRYRKFASTKPMEFIFESLVPYWFINMAGGGYSKNSKKIKKHRFVIDKVREGFRTGARRLYEQYKPNYLIAGHSHIKEDFKLTEESFFLNNGFAPREKTYLQIGPEGHKFIAL